MVQDSTISGNTVGVGDGSGNGGGIDNDGVLTVEDSTVTGNTVSTGGDGGGVYNSDTTTIEASTIAGNSSPSGNGGGIYDASGASDTLAATILATPGGPPTGGECAGASVTDAGYNIDDDGTCVLSATGSVSDSAAIDDYLGSLGSYGGPTETVPLLDSPSPWTSAADPALLAIPSSFVFPDGSPACAGTDQRGFLRQVTCDIGAFELSVSPPAAPGFLAASPGDTQVLLSWEAPADNGSPITSYTVTPYIGLVSQPSLQVEAPATTATVTGLKNGTTYSFFVTATNAVGASASSNQSAAVTPEFEASVTDLSVAGNGAAYGHENVVTFMVAVSPNEPAAPSGSVTVKARNVTLCTVTLPATTCSLGIAKLGAGQYHIVAYYDGDSDFDASSSSVETLDISKAHSDALLTLSALKLTYGDEQAERFSVVVRSKFDPPSGKVVVKSEGRELCAIVLSGGKGTCSMSTKQSKVLSPGVHNVVALYLGSHNFNRATSKGESLKVSG
jgi:hypothetical protein